MKKSNIQACVTALILASTSMPSQALTLTRGTETHLNGSLGDVQVNYVDDTGFLTGYLDSSGLVTDADPIPTKRIQYDLLNNAGNGSIFTYTVFYEPGVTVIGALDPQGYFESDGTQQTFWGGVAFTTLFDAGFGTYTYNVAFGSEWRIDYQPDHVTWTHMGNGFFPDTATGLTEFGFNPTFSLEFAADTVFGLMPANVTGFLPTGAPVSSTGRVLSAVGVVPVPAAAGLFGSGLIGLIGIARRKK